MTSFNRRQQDRVRRQKKMRADEKKKMRSMKIESLRYAKDEAPRSYKKKNDAGIEETIHYTEKEMKSNIRGIAENKFKMDWGDRKRTIQQDVVEKEEIVKQQAEQRRLNGLSK